MQALLLGNGPSVSTADLSSIDRSQVTIFGVNRSLFDIKNPDYLCILDNTIEEQYVPVDGQVQGLLTYPGCKFSKHPQALCHAMAKHKACEGWPSHGSPFLNSRNSGGFCFQWILEMGFTNIGILGIEYSHTQLWEQKKPTHSYGTNKVTKRSPSMKTGLPFWNLAKAHCAKAGIAVHNLCPYPVPFDEVGFPKMAFTDWCATPSPPIVPQIITHPPKPDAKPRRTYRVEGRRPCRVRRIS